MLMVRYIKDFSYQAVCVKTIATEALSFRSSVFEFTLDGGLLLQSRLAA